LASSAAAGTSADGTASIRSIKGEPVVAKLVECASCGAFVEVSEAAADSDQHPEALEQAPELVRFYCTDCWSEGAR
jgi:hypothetical protein